LIQINAEDSGDAGLLTSSEGVSAQKKLMIKRGCPVMLIRNISSELVNGSIGRVVDFNEESHSPVVDFQDLGIVITLKKLNFTGKNLNQS
jgi:membrane protease subunit (stomatin/prohibitin family)